MNAMKKFILSVCFVVFALSVVVQFLVPFRVKAGIRIANLYRKRPNDCEAKFVYKMGVGIEYAFDPVWLLQPSLNFCV